MTDDKCCFVCRTPSGVCATKYRCDHHVAARSEMERAVTVYSDPTGERAVGNVMREQKRKNRAKRRKA
jgi:hypothetical protein